MTRKDYIKIARVIKDNTSTNEDISYSSSRLYKYNLIDDLIDIFEDDNPLFDRQRFINACE